MSVKEIVKASFLKAQQDGLQLTPDVYKTIFCEQAKKRGYNISDCNLVDKYLNKMSEEQKKELKNLNVKNLDELFMYLISRLNRATNSKDENLTQAFIVLIKKLLEVISILHNKSAKDLVIESENRLKNSYDLNTLDVIKKRWSDFVSNYNDSFLNPLIKKPTQNKNDLKSLIDDLLNEIDDSYIHSIVEILSLSIEPSIAKENLDDFRIYIEKIENEPFLLKNRKNIDELKNLVSKRIDLDKNEIQKNIKEIDKLIELISSNLKTSIASSDKSSKNISQIKQELHLIDKENEFESIKQKLLSIAQNLENETIGLKDKLVSQNSEMESLETKINELQNKLDSVQKESRIDFLTGALNRRAFDEELHKLEKSYLRYKKNYSIVFFDIDKFKNINDTYGHDAGDLIISSFGKLLIKYSREMDIVARFGGEEFIVVLPNTEIIGAVEYANKIRVILESSKFLYKSLKVSVTVSAGVSERTLCNSSQEALTKADEELYLAKNSGRNRVYPQK
ncbi:MAG: diguanylate cyclase [Campylobacterales bacterium]|nr:diguanylate cyclase [Campylobacterales bacterium]